MIARELLNSIDYNVRWDALPSRTPELTHSPPHHSTIGADAIEEPPPPTTPLPLAAVGDRGRGKHAVHLLAEENPNLKALQRQFGEDRKRGHINSSCKEIVS